MLDFYLIGIARSGTSVSQRALNLHPNIFCGLERFSTHIHPKSVKFPESFLDTSMKGNPLGISQAQSVISKMTDSELNLLRVIGDKMPHKIYAPSHLSSVQNNLFIYRPYQDVCASWDVRAKNQNDHSWSQYRTGFFVFFDLIVFLFFVSKINNLNCVDYKSCFYGDFESELAIWFNCLGVSLEEYPLDHFSKQILRKSLPENNINSDVRYDKFADFINLPEFEKKYFSSTSNHERVNCINEYSQHIHNNHILFMNKFFDLLTKYEYEELLSIASKIDRNFTKEEKSLFVSSDIDSKLQLFFSEKNEKQTAELISLMPNSPQLKIRLSHFLQKNGKLLEAVEQIRGAISLNADDPTWHNRLANLLVKTGNIDEAKKHEKIAAVSLNNGDPYFYVTLSRVYEKENKLKQAINEMYEAIRIKADDPALQHRLANLLVQIGNIDEAKEHLKIAVSLNNGDPHFHVTLSRVYEKENKLEQAINEMYEAIRIKADDPTWHNRLANLLVQVGNIDEAKKHGKIAAVSLNNGDPHFYVTLSRIYEKENKLEQAINEMCEAIRIKADDPTWHNRLANLLVQVGNIDEAKKHGKIAAVSLNNGDPHFYVTLSRIYENENKLEQAVNEMHEAIKIKADNPALQHRLANLLVQIGNIGEAKKHAKIAVSLNNSDPHFHVTLSRIYENENKLDQAVNEMHEATRIKADNPALQNRLSKLLLQSRNRDEVEKHF